MGVIVTALLVEEVTALVSGDWSGLSVSSLLAGSLTIWQSPTVMICVFVAPGGAPRRGGGSSESTRESSSSVDESDTSMVRS